MEQVRFLKLSLEDQVQYLYKNGSFVSDIKYHEYKVNLFLLDGEYFEVFINQKAAQILNILPIDYRSNRLDRYLDQVKLPVLN